MPEYTQMFIVICILFVVVMLTRKFHAWKIKRAYFSGMVSCNHATSAAFIIKFFNSIAKQSAIELVV